MERHERMWKIFVREYSAYKIYSKGLSIANTLNEVTAEKRIQNKERGYRYVKYSSDAGQY